MLGNASYYNQSTRRYIALFGTMFNEIEITRGTGGGAQTMKVPITHAPIQKFLARISQDPDLDKPSALTMPRMSFEMLDMTYAPERKLTRHQHRKTAQSTDDDSFLRQFVPAPYDLNFQLNIAVKYPEDGYKIVEQILPYFKPEWTSSVQLIDDFNVFYDVATVLNSVTYEDTYDGDFKDRRAVIWTLNFTMQAWYFGPTTTKKVIKFANTAVYSSLSANTQLQHVTVQPGLTANGEPTTDINETVPYADINSDDDWAFIVRYEDAT